MFDHTARTRRFANLGALALLVAAVGACTSAGAASTTLGSGPGTTTLHRLEGTPYAAGARPEPVAGAASPAPTSTFVGYGGGAAAARTPKLTPTAPSRDGRTGTHPGGGGPQE
jgi:hypothetical protein